MGLTEIIFTLFVQSNHRSHHKIESDRKRSSNKPEKVEREKNTSQSDSHKGMVINLFEDNNAKAEYQVELHRSKRHGYSTCKWLDGTIHKENWMNDTMNGRRVQTWSDGRCYDGEWKDGKMNGYGVYTWPDGVQYDGEWKDNKRNGHGVQTLPDGEWYDSEWKDDKKSY